MPQIQKESVRKRIMKEAKAAFLVSGYQNTSMRQIAQKSEMTVGNLYRYFENKASLFGAIVDPFLAEIDGVLKETTKDWVSLHAAPAGVFELEGKSYQEAIVTMTRLLVRTIRRHKDESLLILTKSQGYRYGNTLKDTVGWIHEIFVERERTLGREPDLIFTKALSSGFLESLIVMIKDSKSDEEAEVVFGRLIEHYFQIPMAAD
jgi:AcrR family transcriptional regulator